MKNFIRKLNWLNYKYDNLDDDVRFLVFFFFIAIPLSVLCVVSDMWWAIYVCILLLYRVVFVHICKYFDDQEGL